MAAGDDDGTTSEDLEQLRAERDALAEKVERMSLRHRWGNHLRSGVVGVLVVVTTICLIAAGIGVWASRNFLNNDVFDDRLGTIAEEPEVQEALARFATAEIVSLVQPEQLIGDALAAVSGDSGPLPEQAQLLAPVLADQVEGFVADKVLEFFESERFQELFATAVDTAHAAAVDVLEGNESELIQAGADSVTLNFLPILNEILARITEVSPTIFGRTVDLPTVTVDDIPDEAREKIGDALGVTLDDNFGTFTIYDEGALSAAQDALSLFNKVVWLLVILTVLLIPLTIWLSRRRRRTIMQLCVAFAIGGVLVRRLSLRIQQDVLDLVRIPDNVPAVEVTTDRVIDPLRTGALVIVLVALAVLVLAVLTGPYGWVVRLRRGVASLFRAGVTAAKDRSQDEATIEWVHAHRDVLGWAGAGVGVLALLLLDLSWWGLLGLVVLIGAYELVVFRFWGSGGGQVVLGVPEDE